MQSGSLTEFALVFLLSFLAYKCKLLFAQDVVFFVTVLLRVTD